MESPCNMKTSRYSEQALWESFCCTRERFEAQYVIPEALQPSISLLSVRSAFQRYLPRRLGQCARWPTQGNQFHDIQTIAQASALASFNIANVVHRTCQLRCSQFVRHLSNWKTARSCLNSASRIYSHVVLRYFHNRFSCVYILLPHTLFWRPPTWVAFFALSPISFGDVEAKNKKVI